MVGKFYTPEYECEFRLAGAIFPAGLQSSVSKAVGVDSIAAQSGSNHSLTSAHANR